MCIDHDECIFAKHELYCHTVVNTCAYEKVKRRGLNLLFVMFEFIRDYPATKTRLDKSCWFSRII